MKKLLPVFLIILMTLPHSVFSQSETTDFGIKWSGFIKTDFMYDTRQTVNAREGHFNILPAAENLDANGDDLNAQANFNILSIQSRLKGSISGPDFFGMKTSGAIEADFFGNGGDENGFRLRHAFVKISNDKFEILTGQYWHPMFVTAVFPGTYSFNTGVPFQPFSRNPQLRFSTKGAVKVIAVLFTERDFKTSGASVSQSGMPQAHAQIQMGSSDNILGGLGVNYKTAKPALGSEDITSTSFIGYAKAKLGDITLKAEGIYGQNMSDLLMISGFGENADGDFINNNTLSVWTEVSGSLTESMEFGFFGGYSENSGFGEAINFVGGFRGDQVANLYRVSPRVGWNSGKMKIGIEGEYTVAQYAGIDVNGDMDFTGVDPVSNFRLLFTAIYKF